MDKERKRASSDDDEDFITTTKTIEELEIWNETFVSKQQNAYRKLDKTVKRLHEGKEKSDKINVELEKMLNISRDENFALKIRIDELEKTMEEKETDFKDLESLNQNMMVREHKYNYENQEARQELMKSMKGLQGGVVIGVKRLGDLDSAPFVAAVKKQKSSGSGLPKADSKTDSCVEAQRLCSLWEKHLRDPGWHPYRMVSDGDKHQEIIDDEDPKLKGLKADLGEDAYKAITTSLMEMNEHNPSGRYPVSEIWNFVEGRKASLKEGYGFVFEKLKIVGKNSVVSSPSIGATISSPNIVAENPSSPTPSYLDGCEIPDAVVSSPIIAATDPSYSAPSCLDGCNAVFHDFMAHKSYGNFQTGQIWALHRDSDRLPRYYVQITEVKLSPNFELLVRHLDSSFSPVSQHLQWSDKRIPISFGKFKASDKTEVCNNVKQFSHMLSAKLVSKNNYEIYPRRGEVWALYKCYHPKWRSERMTSRKYDIVEVLINDDDCYIKVLVLEQATGFKTVYKPSKKSRFKVTKEIKHDKFHILSHQIPAFRLTDEKEGSLRGLWELDPCSIPVCVFPS